MTNGTAPPPHPRGALHHRLSVDKLNAVQLDRLRKAFRMSGEKQDNTGFAWFAGLHGVPQHFCQHHIESEHGRRFFLPWHPSYRGAVFFNRRGVDHDTPEDGEHGYAGAFFVFGKGGCFGEEGHCHPRGRRDRFDTRLVSQAHPTARAVDVTEALRRELLAGAEQLRVTIVPEVADPGGVLIDGDLEAPVKFDQLALVTYDAYAPAAQRANLSA